MPRNGRGRGGKRQGQQGVAYAQRRDLQVAQPVRAASGQEYGARQAQEQAQQQMPLPAVSRVAPAQPSLAQGGPAPGSLTPLDAPTARPNEPLTTGLPMGPGAGPEVLTMSGGNTTLDRLRAAYLADPNEDLREVIATIEATGG